MGGFLLFKAEVPGSNLLGHLPKEFFLRLIWCPWLVGYYGTRRLIEVHVSWPEHPRYLKKKKKKKIWVQQFCIFSLFSFIKLQFLVKQYSLY